MKISLIILHYNAYEDTRDCLESLKKLDVTNVTFDTIVVDNASTNSSLSILKKEYPAIIFLENNKNLGYAEGNNVGIRYSLKQEVDYIWLLNNDTFVNKYTLQELLRAAEEKSSGGIFAPKIYFAPGHETHIKRYKKSEIGKIIWYAGGILDWENMLASHKGVDEVDTGQFEQLIKTQYITGCSMFIKNLVFKKVGLLDKKFYLYYEDVDFSLRTYNKGFDLIYVPHSHIWHKNASASGGSGSDLQEYYITRNRLLIGMRYAPWKTKLALLRESLNLIMHGTNTQKEAIGDFLRKKYGKRGTAIFSFPTINLLQIFNKKKQDKKI